MSERILFDIKESDIENIDSCVACGSKDMQIISDCSLPNGLKFFSTAICKTCNHVYRNTRPYEKWFENAFEFRHKSQQKQNKSPLNPEIEEQRYKRYESIARVFKNNFPNVNKVLDVGCGPGTGMNAFRDLNFYIEGVDSDISRSKFAVEQGHKVFQGKWQDFKTEVEFDLITSIHSIEHFYDPEAFLKSVKQIAAPSTLLYLEVPEVIDHVLDWNDSLYLAHISNFNEFSMAILAERAGWKLVERVYPNKGTGFHEGHLCMVFENSDESSKTNALDKYTTDKISSVYTNDLPGEFDKEAPYHLKVSEINDLSLTYKNSTELKKLVHENYKLREIKNTGDNNFEIY